MDAFQSFWIMCDFIMFVVQNTMILKTLVTCFAVRKCNATVRHNYVKSFIWDNVSYCCKFYLLLFKR